MRNEQGFSAQRKTKFLLTYPPLSSFFLFWWEMESGAKVREREILRSRTDSTTLQKQRSESEHEKGSGSDKRNRGWDVSASTCMGLALGVGRCILYL